MKNIKYCFAGGILLIVLLAFIAIYGCNKSSDDGKTEDKKSNTESAAVNEDVISKIEDNTESLEDAMDKNDGDGNGNTIEISAAENNEEDEQLHYPAGLEVHFIDVGQGDSTLIICGGEAMLIDAGGNDYGTAVQNYLRKCGVSRLKYVMVSHPDADHIGGLDVIVYKFDCDNILFPNADNDTYAYESLMRSISEKGYKETIVDVGDKYALGDAAFEILSPYRDFTFEETNNSSIICKLTYGEKHFLFAGDAQIQALQPLIFDDEIDSRADVIKVPHHGAASSYVKAFYDKVQPEYAIISCGYDNSYGHPHEAVLNDLKSRGVSLYRTDIQGTVIAYCDGQHIEFSKLSTDNWEPGVYYDEWRENNIYANDDGKIDSHVDTEGADASYVLNLSSHKFHRPNCQSVSNMSEKNRLYLNCSREEIIQLYKDASPCGYCRP